MIGMSPVGSHRSLVAIVAGIAVAPCLAQVHWSSEQPGRTGHRIAWHEATRQLVMFGGWPPESLFFHQPSQRTAETRLWRSGDWVLARPTTSPPPSAEHSLTEFPPTGELILFGGQPIGGGTPMWSFDGSTWRPQNLTTLPPARSRHGACYDPARRRIVLFGGESLTGTALGDTWEFDGAQWLAQSPAASPPAGRSDAMAFNPVTQRAAMFQGHGPVFEWNGTTWLTLTPPAPPNPSGMGLRRHSLVTDPDGLGVLLVSADDLFFSIMVPVCARWDGIAWTQLPGIERAGQAVALDPKAKQVVAHGGLRRFEGWEPNVLETWTWHGSWQLAATRGPSGRLDPAVLDVPSAGGLVVFGGQVGDTMLDDAWLRPGARWQPWSPLPTWVSGVGAALDRARNRVVVFGGCNFSPTSCFSPMAQTWEWHTGQWHVLTVAGPSARHRPAMAYDAARQRTVLFGGEQPFNVVLRDTWEWDGAQWQQRAPATAPPAAGPMIAAGDLGLAMNSGGQIWNYDGTDWRVLFAAPAAGNLAFDAGRNRLVLLANNGVHERVGTSWQLRLAESHLGPACWSSEFRRVVVFEPDGSLWQYGPDATAHWYRFGSGCGGSATPTAENDPYAGTTWRVRFGGVAPTTARIDCLGLSRTNSGGVPLPADLAALGMPGCSQWVALDQLTFGAGDTWSIAIPGSTAFVGIEFYAQSLLAAPTANPFGFTATAALGAVIGAP